MKIKLLLLVLLGCSTATAQKSVQGELKLKKTDNKDFILRNTKVMLQTKNGIDSTAMKDDLTFSFENIQSESATIYLKSPVVSPNAATTFTLKKNKPTKLKLNYGAIHRYSDSDPIKQRQDNERFAEFANTLSAIQVVANIFVAISLIIK